MATVSGVTSGSSSSSSTSHNITLPANSSGDLVIVAIAVDQEVTPSFPGGWSEEYGTVIDDSEGGYYDVQSSTATGSTSLTVTLDGSSDLSYVAVVFTNAAMAAPSADDLGSDDSPDVTTPSGTPAPATPFLQVYFFGCIGDTTVSSYPSDHASNNESGGNTYCRVGLAIDSTSTLHDPDAWTLADSVSWAASVHVVEPTTTVHGLLADDIESASEVETVPVTQEHGLLADDIESASEVETVPVTQEHALLADDVESASEVDTIPVGQEHALLADDIESASDVDDLPLVQEHVLLADDIESSSEAEAVPVGQEHGLLADDIESASEVDTVPVDQSHTLLADDVESASEVETTPVGQDHALLADDIESASEVETVPVGQEHALLADDIESASEVSDPSIAESNHLLLADDIESASEVSQPDLAEDNTLLADDIESASSISTPDFSEANALLADDVESTSESTEPAISQEQTILAFDVESASELSTPVFSETNALLADDIESASELSVPTVVDSGATTDALMADDIESVTSVSAPALTQTVFALLSTDIESRTEPAASRLTLNNQEPNTKRCCCDPVGCEVAEDDFNRPDSTNLGSKWIEISGDAEIDNQQLHIAVQGITLTTARQPHPVNGGANYNLLILVDIIYEPGEEYHIICGFEDENNFDWVRIYPDGTSDGGQPNYLCSLNRRTAGVDAVLMDIASHPKTGKWQFQDVGGVFQSSLRICYSTVEWSVSGMRPDETFWTLCDAGGKSQLPNNSAHGLVGFIRGRFDNFVYTVHYESDPECDGCKCLCVTSDTDYSCLPEYLLLTMTPLNQYCYTNYIGEQECCDDAGPITVLLRQEVPDMPQLPTIPPSDDINATLGPIFGCPDYRTATKRIWYSDPIPADDQGASSGNGQYGIPNANWFSLICESAGDIALSIQQYPRLFSDSNSGADVLFEAPDTGTAAGHENAQFLQLAQSTCDPLSMVFGPVKTDDRPAPGLCWLYATRYSITITEAGGGSCPSCGSYTAQC